jgi:hypothetical protein
MLSITFPSYPALIEILPEEGNFPLFDVSSVSSILKYYLTIDY